jgi:ribosomal protein S6--L-glutamate ligase
VHLTVLSRSSAIYTTRRIAEAARARGHRVRVVDPLQVEMQIGAGGPALFHGRRPFPRTDAVVPRIAPSIGQYGLAVVKQLQLRRVPVLNGAGAIAASRDKMQCLQILAASGIGVPRTVMASDASRLRELARHVGGVPVLVKLVSANDRPGVMICETLQSLEAALEAILGLGQNILVQQYVKGARGRDLRAIVVGGRVVAALRRRARAGRFARTLARGARFEAAALTARQAAAAVDAARTVGLEVCAVDLLDVRGSPLVFEVNSSPGIREAEESCRCDVAGAIVDHAEALAGAAVPAASA